MVVLLLVQRVARATMQKSPIRQSKGSCLFIRLQGAIFARRKAGVLAADWFVAESGRSGELVGCLVGWLADRL